MVGNANRKCMEKADIQDYSICFTIQFEVFSMDVIECMYIHVCLLYWIFICYHFLILFACKNIRAVKIIQNEISTCSLCGPLEQPDNYDFYFFLFQEDIFFFKWKPTNCLWQNCRVFQMLNPVIPVVENAKCSL